MIVLIFILGLLAGYYAQAMYKMLKSLYDELTERQAAKQAGVVKVSPNRLTKNTPIDLSTDSGGIRRPNPDEVLLASMKQTDENLKTRYP